MYKTIDDILADIGKTNVTPKHLIQAAYKLGAGEVEEEVVEEVLEVEEGEDEEDDS
tara:strand:- start:384 stop:551 length:168 start_codon:yes stop_codon:yes gene_type:complete